MQTLVIPTSEWERIRHKRTELLLLPLQNGDWANAIKHGGSMGVKEYLSVSRGEQKPWIEKPGKYTLRTASDGEPLAYIRIYAIDKEGIGIYQMFYPQKLGLLPHETLSPAEVVAAWIAEVYGEAGAPLFWVCKFQWTDSAGKVLPDEA